MLRPLKLLSYICTSINTYTIITEPFNFIRWFAIISTIIMWIVMSIDIKEVK